MAVIITNEHELQKPSPPARRYGLFDVATSMGDTGERVIASGLQFVAEDCGLQVVPYDPTCAAPHAEKVFTPGTPIVDAKPYWLLASYQCGTVGTTAADVRRRVLARYNAGVQHAVENVVWTGGGLAGQEPALTTAGATVVVPTAPGAGAAISALEEAFYDAHGYVGTIHVNQRATGALKYSGMLDRREAGIWRTPLGSNVSLGAGYGITGPAAVAPAAGFVWAFMTPQVYLWSSAVNQPDPVQTLDRSLNQWMALAETVYAHAWLCDTVFAVQVPIAAPATAATPAVP